MTTSNSRIRRYRTQSLEYLANAYQELRHGRWSRSEELLWSSLTLAVKGTALSQGAVLNTQEEVEAYAAKLGREWHDRRIRDAFAQIAKFSDAAQRARESRYRIDRLSMMLEDLRSTVEQLWDIVDSSESHEPR